MRVGEDGERAIRNFLMKRIGDAQIEVGIPGAPDDVNRDGEGLEARDAGSIVRHCREEVARERAKRLQSAGFGEELLGEEGNELSSS